MTNKPGTVYIVHAVDTEGPLYEDLGATFDRIRDRFGVEIEPSLANLEKIRNKQIDLGGAEDAIAHQCHPDQLKRYLGTWDQIDQMHETTMSKTWREGLADSVGEPYVVSWFCMDHVHYNNNPRRRAMGYHAVFDHYRDLLTSGQCPRDRIYFHYHPPAPSGDAHAMGRGFAMPRQVQDEILARRIIDRQWFPVANRPGGHHEAYDSNVWLEAWLPFDLANQNKTNDSGRDELRKSGLLPGHVSDWRGAPTDWEIYNPDLHDFRRPGNMRRWIGRCLNMSARHSVLTKDELEMAFNAASSGRNVLVSVTNHDFRDMVDEVETFVDMVREVAAEFPTIDFRWANTVEAFRKVLGLERKPAPSVSVELTDRFIRVTSDSPVWGAQPFLAVRTPVGGYYRLNMIADSDREFSLPFDSETTTLDAVAEFGIGYNDRVGNTSVVLVDTTSSKDTQVIQHNDTDWLT